MSDPSQVNSAIRIDKRSRITNAAIDSKRPVRIKCTNCGNKVLIVVQTKQLFAYPPGDPRIAATGYDREISTENWCLSCIRSSFIEDDNYRTKVAVAI